VQTLRPVNDALYAQGMQCGMSKRVAPKPELKLILARDREQQLRLWALDGGRRR
jgi:hypothetical protein